MPAPKKRSRTAVQTIAGVLHYSSVALADEMEAAIGFKSPESFKRHLLKALDEHAGFQKLVHEWHKHSHASQAKLSQAQVSRPIPASGRPQAARFEGGNRSKGGKRS